MLQILDLLEQKVWNDQVICIHFLSVAFFVARLVVIQKILPSNHKDVGMRCNEGPSVCSSNLMYY